MGSQSALEGNQARVVQASEMAIGVVIGGGRLLVVRVDSVAEACELYMCLAGAVERRLWWTRENITLVAIGADDSGMVITADLDGETVAEEFDGVRHVVLSACGLGLPALGVRADGFVRNQ